MVRKKIEIKKIEKASTRMVTFSKRRKGLFKKVTALHSRTAAKAAVVVFSPGGKPFTHGEPSVDSVINDYFRSVGHQENEGNNVGPTDTTCSSVPAVNPAKEWLEGVEVEECENMEVTVLLKKLEEIEKECEYQKLLRFLFDG